MLIMPPINYMNVNRASRRGTDEAEKSPGGGDSRAENAIEAAIAAGLPSDAVGLLRTTCAAHTAHMAKAREQGDAGS